MHLIETSFKYAYELTRALVTVIRSLGALLNANNPPSVLIERPTFLLIAKETFLSFQRWRQKQQLQQQHVLNESFLW